MLNKNGSWTKKLKNNQKTLHIERSTRAGFDGNIIMEKITNVVVG